MLVQCWPAVYDVGSTLIQYQFNVSCPLGKGQFTQSAKTANYVNCAIKNMARSSAHRCSLHSPRQMALVWDIIANVWIGQRTFHGEKK